MLQVQDLTAGYGGPPVLRGVSFDVAAGQRLCVLGPNGCGKTTLLRAVAGLLPCTGRVTVAGCALAALPARQRAQRVALLSQYNPPVFGYTVYETVLLGRYARQPAGLWETVTPADRAAVRESLERTDTWPLRDRKLGELSGGQQQRVLLARAFAQAPQVLLLDEPTNHLDLRCQVDLVAAVRTWVGEGSRCVVAVLHDLNLALRFADTALLLQDGRVRAQAPAAALGADVLSEVYDLDVRGYMLDALRRWEGMG